MSDEMTRAPGHGNLAKWPRWDLDYTVQEDDVDADRCVIYPQDAERAGLESKWILADEGSYVAIEDVR